MRGSYNWPQASPEERVKVCELISQQGTMLLGIILKLKGNPPAGDGGLQCSVKEGTRSENKVSDTFSFHMDKSWFTLYAVHLLFCSAYS